MKIINITWLFLFSVQVLAIPVLQSYPFIALLSGLSLSILLNSASAIKNCLSVSDKQIANCELRLLVLITPSYWLERVNF